MHHHIWIVHVKHLAHRGRVGDIGAHQQVAGTVPRILQRLFRRGIGHFVHIDHDMSGVPDQVANDGGTNETAAAGQ